MIGRMSFSTKTPYFLFSFASIESQTYTTMYLLGSAILSRTKQLQFISPLEMVEIKKVLLEGDSRDTILIK